MNGKYTLMKKYIRYMYAMAAVLVITISLAACGCKSKTASDSKQTATDTNAGKSSDDEDEPDKAQNEEYDMEKEFYILEFDKNSEIFSRIDGKSYKADCTLDVSELRYLHILHVDFDGNTAEGELICNKAIAETLLDIFKELYTSGYQIEKVRLVDEYDADDERSMADNNSSCFNFRFISHTTKVSKHGAGMAVDINPLYNPYIKQVNGRTSIEPANSVDYVDRSWDFEHKIDENDLAYKLFTQAGFSWGGAWKNSKDYQHFEM